VIRCKSKRVMLEVDAPQKMFAGAVDTVKRLAPELRDGWTYRGEVLARPRHNALSYGRVPTGNIILYDVNDGHESYLRFHERGEEAKRLGLEVVHTSVIQGSDLTQDMLKELLARESALGGCKVEGTVIKNYGRFGRDGKVLMGKHVSEAFKEKHGASWKAKNPRGKDVVGNLSAIYRSERRWMKAVERLRDDGALLGEPRDIGALIKEVVQDLEAECAEEIKEELWKWARKNILRNSTRGLAEWYKGQLVAEQFKDEQ